MWVSSYKAEYIKYRNLKPECNVSNEKCLLNQEGEQRDSNDSILVRLKWCNPILSAT